jgi:hypothetical protein
MTAYELILALTGLAGLACEVVGALLMANGYTGVGGGAGIPRLLLSALVRGPLARGTAAVDHLAPENRLSSLQGLALIGLGFALQFLTTALLLARSLLGPPAGAAG